MERLRKNPWRSQARHDERGNGQCQGVLPALITEIDIGLVARELLANRIVQESDCLLQCDCPNHTSNSHRSLHIMLDKQGWYCFGCGVGGDVLQLVEFNSIRRGDHRAVRPHAVDSPAGARLPGREGKPASTRPARSFT